MRRFAWFVVVALAAPAAADPKSPDPAAKPAEPCKRRVVGRGLDRKVVCEFSSAIVVSSNAPKPSVLIVPRDGKNVTGRPRSTDPLKGLSRRLRD